MWNSSIKAEYLASTMVQVIEAYSIRGTETVLVDSINELRKQFPNCTDAEINDILSLCFEMYNMYIKKYPKKSKGRAYEDTLERLVDEIKAVVEIQ